MSNPTGSGLGSPAKVEILSDFIVPTIKEAQAETGGLFEAHVSEMADVEDLAYITSLRETSEQRLNMNLEAQIRYKYPNEIGINRGIDIAIILLVNLTICSLLEDAQHYRKELKGLRRLRLELERYGGGIVYKGESVPSVAYSEVDVVKESSAITEKVYHGNMPLVGI